MKKLRTIDLYLIPLFFVGLTTVILRSVALLTCFNSLTLHVDDKIIITISSVMILLSVIGFASYLFLGEKEKDFIVRTDNARNYLPAGILSIALLSGCNKQLMDLTYSYEYAIIGLPNGEVVEGKVTSWTDYEDGDQLQVKIDGKTYLVHSSNVVLISK